MENSFTKSIYKKKTDSSVLLKQKSNINTNLDDIINDVNKKKEIIPMNLSIINSKNTKECTTIDYNTNPSSIRKISNIRYNTISSNNNSIGKTERYYNENCNKQNEINNFNKIKVDRNNKSDHIIYEKCWEHNRVYEALCLDCKK